MSIREEEIASLRKTMSLFKDLADPKRCPRIPSDVRKKARTMYAAMHVLLQPGCSANQKDVLQDGRKLIYSILLPYLTPRVPKSVREKARRVCKHYPLMWDERGF